LLIASAPDGDCALHCFLQFADYDGITSVDEVFAAFRVLVKANQVPIPTMGQIHEIG
jgi:hypothetical protein